MGGTRNSGAARPSHEPKEVGELQSQGGAAIHLFWSSDVCLGKEKH